MASHTRQSKFYRHLSAGIFATLILCLLPDGQATFAQTEPEGEPSGYSQYQGEPFFLLGDKSYGTKDEARVRLEVQGRNFSSLQQYGGVDIVLYQITDPIRFLNQQKNLHRIKTDGNYAGEELSNTLSFLWDDWYRKSRRYWQNIFTSEARTGVTNDVPQLHTPSSIDNPTEFSNPPQFALLPEKNGFKFAQRFRYPVMHATPIQPPAGVLLEGSSSNFDMSIEGNVYIPLGKLQPGLYLVEAIVGGFRANTLIFVSDTVAITKTSAAQMMVWTAHRGSGAPVPNVQLSWTDGVGVLGKNKTDDRGIAIFNHADPEKSYLIGQDEKGGVLISENFYYDSEIYNTKIYAMTDRPLYRPGDDVNVQILGRKFTSALVSVAAAQSSINLEVIDPNGTPVVTQKLQFNGQNGAQTIFRLPENATAGGYELRYKYQDNIYSAAFRVAEYIKPHFEISVQPDKDNFKTNEPVNGRIVLTYPDGKPVASAQVQLTVRAQTTTMVEGELQYTGLFPIEVQTKALVTDSDGVARFSLPAATEPSRYVLTTFASDGAAYRVKATKELLIERSASVYRLYAAQQFSQPNESVLFNFEAVENGVTPARPARYEIILLEAQKKSSGKIDNDANKLRVNFVSSGSYTVMIYDEKGNVLGSTNHWVAGAGVKVVKGSIEIVLNRTSYQPDDMADALITFPEPVDSALLTLERDRVEQSTLLQKSNQWISTQRIAPTQWRAKIKISKNMAPNMTFSVAYVKDSEWVFQNHGILVEQPRIQVTFKTDKEVYQPGETVKVDVETKLGGKALAANVSVGVVDEMIYVLQPEITPNIFDFFYHLRRNNVRTQSSLQFISYDMASNRKSAPPTRGSSRERGFKVLERPRRENIDTAYWNGQLMTDSNGHTSFTFVMPDSLTRWRITGRAMSAQGMVGQRTAYLRSEKPFYAKWISPNWMRSGDAPIATLAVFNQTEHTQNVEINISGNGVDQSSIIEAKRGINTLNVALDNFNGNTLHAEIRIDSKPVDMLDITMRHDTLDWKSPQSIAIPVNSKELTLNLPMDASNIKVSFAKGAARQFARIVDDLDDYAYGCVEQTASRLLPLSYVLQSLPQDTGGDRARITQQLRQRLQHQRLRLVYMAGPNATFGWWGNAAQDDLLLTTYAYYADYTASRVLGFNLPAEHWEKLLPLFAQEDSSNVGHHSLIQRALALWMANDMGLPTRTLVLGAIWELETNIQPANSDNNVDPFVSPALLQPQSNISHAMAIVLISQLAEQHQLLPLPPKVTAALPSAQNTLQQSALPSAQALLLLGSQNVSKVQEAEHILQSVRSEMPTFDRALTLVWLNKILVDKTTKPVNIQVTSPWVHSNSITGTDVWRWKESSVPTTLSLEKTPEQSLTAYVQYESSAHESSKLAVNIDRKLYRMVPEAENSDSEITDKNIKFSLSLLSDSDEIQTNELYLEEIILTPENDTRVRYGLVESPLPPGAEVESSTWGISFADNSVLERANNQPSHGGYAVPVEQLNHPVTIRHLLRFSQKGRYNLPPARFYSMYAPQDKAFESTTTTRMLTVK